MSFKVIENKNENIQRILLAPMNHQAIAIVIITPTLQMRKLSHLQSV